MALSFSITFKGISHVAYKLSTHTCRRCSVFWPLVLYEELTTQLICVEMSQGYLCSASTCLHVFLVPGPDLFRSCTMIISHVLIIFFFMLFLQCLSFHYWFSYFLPSFLGFCLSYVLSNCLLGTVSFAVLVLVPSKWSTYMLKIHVVSISPSSIWFRGHIHIPTCSLAILRTKL